MGHRSEFEDLISLYALGVLDEDEAKEFEEHLSRRCKICEKNLRETESVLSLIPYSLADTPLSPGLGGKVFKGVESAGRVKKIQKDR